MMKYLQLEWDNLKAEMWSMLFYKSTYIIVLLNFDPLSHHFCGYFRILDVMLSEQLRCKIGYNFMQKRLVSKFYTKIMLTNILFIYCGYTIKMVNVLVFSFWPHSLFTFQCLTITYIFDCCKEMEGQGLNYATNTLKYAQPELNWEYSSCEISFAF